jgi:hypothetical protein
MTQQVLHMCILRQLCPQGIEHSLVGGLAFKLQHPLRQREHQRDVGVLADAGAEQPALLRACKVSVELFEEVVWFGVHIASWVSGRFGCC